MKHLFFWAIGLSSIVWAQSPEPLGGVRGVVFSSLVERLPFVFSEGAFTDCTKSEAQDFTVFSCELKGTSVKVGGQNYTFTTSQVMYESHHSGKYKTYRFFGTHTERVDGFDAVSDVALTLWHYDKARNEIHGSLDLKTFALHYSLEGRSHPER